MRHRVIIAGSREFTDYETLEAACDAILGPLEVECILSGCAKGADELGERYAKERGYVVEPFPADWKTHGRPAGIIRNKQMAEKADMLIAFWDGYSPGTKHMVWVATEMGLTVFLNRTKGKRLPQKEWNRRQAYKNNLKR